MGAWGPGIYENDDAADWIAELRESGLDAVESALDAAIEDAYLDATTGACALAAAEVIARLVSGRGESSVYSDDVAAWVDANPVEPPASLVVKAKGAVGRVRSGDSELAELWAEDIASQELWSASVTDVELRLGP